jgi:hypothetical protein
MRPHGITFQKAVIFTLTTMRIWNLNPGLGTLLFTTWVVSPGIQLQYAEGKMSTAYKKSHSYIIGISFFILRDSLGALSWYCILTLLCFQIFTLSYYLSHLIICYFSITSKDQNPSWETKPLSTERKLTVILLICMKSLHLFINLTISIFSISNYEHLLVKLFKFWILYRQCYEKLILIGLP